MLKGLISTIVIGGVAINGLIGWNFGQGQVSERLEDLNTTEAIHYMANAVIKAEDNIIWGKINPTPANIDYMIERIENEGGYVNEEGTTDHEMLEDLKEWKEGDFTSAVDVHNKVWGDLDGSIGYANRLNHKKIERLNKIYNY